MAQMSVKELLATVDKLVPSKDYPHDKFIIMALKEAVAAAVEGNFGVGAVLVRGEGGGLVQKGHNHVFAPYFRSDQHAEMDVLTKLEDQNRTSHTVEGITLFSSLEPCPMCLGRLIIAGIREVYYAAPDADGGMVSRFDSLPPVMKDMAKRQKFAQAQCSPELSELALKIFNSTAEKNNNRLKSR
jgi:cytosine deaminase